MMSVRFIKWVVILVILALVLPAAAQEPVTVPALAETTPSPGNGGNGVALWIHPDDETLSLLLTGDDNAGLGVYDLNGEQLQFIDADGGINNVDLRYNFPLSGEYVTLVVGAVKDEPGISLYTVDAELRSVNRIGILETGIPLNGICMYHSAVSGGTYVFAVSEDGDVEQYLLMDDGSGQVTGELRRAFSVGSEAEGCVADDELGNLFLGEEEIALWRYGAEPEDGTNRRIIDVVSTDNVPGNIEEQVEGLALYYMADGQGYLIASNESADSFLVYERGGRQQYIGTFKIGAGEGVDGVSEPNGFDVINNPAGELYPEGVFVTADDNNSQPNADNNFKLASWADIAAALEITSDAAYDLRTVGAPERTVVMAAALVEARAETQPVSSGTDAADDPAVWIHPTDPSMSTIIGSDKTPDGGLGVYDLSGELIQFVPVGRVNNVDLRYRFPLGDEEVAIVAGTNRTENSIVLFAVDQGTRELRNVAARPLVSDMREVYGICLYVSPISGRHYAFVNSADTGEVEQYLLADNGSGLIDIELVREFFVGSQTEGCVADDELGVVYIGEEAVGIWRYGAEPDDGEGRVQVDTVTAQGGYITPDTEGLTIYYGSNGTGYLIVSSQGSSEFIVYTREGANAYVGTFAVREGAVVDAVSGTDGIDVTNFPLGDGFPDGVFVAQDDLNINPDENQNFKLVPWGAIAEALGLEVNTVHDPRMVGAE